MKLLDSKEKAIDREWNRGVGDILKVLLGEDDTQRVTMVVRLRKMAVPLVLEYVGVRLLKAVRGRNVLRRNRAALALHLLGPRGFGFEG